MLERLKRDCGVDGGVKKLRAVTEKVSAATEPFRRDVQVRRVLELLRTAADSQGKRKIVLAAGRDGVTLCTPPHSFLEVATTATITIHDRRGQRLGSVRLAYAPELGQGTTTEELTALIREVLAAWDGPPPRLCYVTDAGDQEVKFFRQVLRKMSHPRSGARREWVWIVDFDHAAQRITTMAEALFGDTDQARG